MYRGWASVLVNIPGRFGAEECVTTSQLEGRERFDGLKGVT